MKSRFDIEIKDERRTVQEHRGWKFEIWWRDELTMIASGYAPSRAMAVRLGREMRQFYDMEYATRCGVKNLHRARKTSKYLLERAKFVK